MFKYSEKVGEKMVIYEADTAENVANLVDMMNSKAKCGSNPNTSNATDDSVVIGQLS